MHQFSTNQFFPIENFNFCWGIMFKRPFLDSSGHQNVDVQSRHRLWILGRWIGLSEFPMSRVQVNRAEVIALFTSMQTLCWVQWKGVWTCCLLAGSATINYTSIVTYPCDFLALLILYLQQIKVKEQNKSNWWGCLSFNLPVTTKSLTSDQLWDFFFIPHGPMYPNGPTGQSEPRSVPTYWHKTLF